MLPLHHSNSHPPSLYKPGPPSSIEMTKSWSLYPVLRLCVQVPLSMIPLLLWGQVSLLVYVHCATLLLHSPRVSLHQCPYAQGEAVISRLYCFLVSSTIPRLLLQKLAPCSSRGFGCHAPEPLHLQYCHTPTFVPAPSWSSPVPPRIALDMTVCLDDRSHLMRL